jgi:hypothetical protein
MSVLVDELTELFIADFGVRLQIHMVFEDIAIAFVEDFFQ